MKQQAQTPYGGETVVLFGLLSGIKRVKLTKRAHNHV